MALLTTIALVLAAWCVAGVATAALYSVLRTRQIRRQRTLSPAGHSPRHAPGHPDVFQRG